MDEIPAPDDGGTNDVQSDGLTNAMPMLSFPSNTLMLEVTGVSGSPAVAYLNIFRWFVLTGSLGQPPQRARCVPCFTMRERN